MPSSIACAISEASRSPASARTTTRMVSSFARSARTRRAAVVSEPGSRESRGAAAQPERHVAVLALPDLARTADLRTRPLLGPAVQGELRGPRHQGRDLALTTDYRDSLSLSGVIGLQHHGEAAKTYRWRNLRAQATFGRASHLASLLRIHRALPSYKRAPA